jgi:MFS family permease
VPPWLPRLVGRLGVIAAMAAGQLLCIVCFLLLPLRIDLVFWFGLRFLIGLGTTLTWVASQSAINAMADEASRGRVMGAYAALFSVGYAIGPGLISLTGSAGVLPFVLCVALLGLGLLLLTLVRGVEHVAARRGSRGVLVILRLAPLALGAVLVFGLLETASFAFLPLYGLRIGYGQAEAALMLTALIGGSIALQLPVGWLADRMPRAFLVLGLLATCSLLALLWPVGLPDRILAWPLLMATGGAVGGLYTLGLTLLGQQFHGGAFTVAYTIMVMTYQLGAILGPVVAGIAIGLFGIHGMPVVLALAPALVLAAGIARVRARAGRA